MQADKPSYQDAPEYKQGGSYCVMETMRKSSAHLLWGAVQINICPYTSNSMTSSLLLWTADSESG